ncbi:MAG: ATP-dependent DNA helicase RecG [Patescibacteria group bacterium]|jgi:ATP-dependent DNA helicase RecG
MDIPEESTKIQFLKGVGPKMADKFNRLGIDDVEDLLFHWPRRYEDYTRISRISDLNGGARYDSTAGENTNPYEYDPSIHSVRGRVLGVVNKLTSRQRMKITEAVVEDGSGTIKLVWFNQPFLKQTLRVGSEWIFRGKVIYDSFNHVYVMESPNRVKFPCIVPVYPTTAGLTSNYITKLISSQRQRIASLIDPVPGSVIAKYKLSPLVDAVLKLHTPVRFEDIQESQRRIAFDELFLLSLCSRMIKDENRVCQAPIMRIDNSEIDDFINALPFGLTDDQKTVTWQVIKDMASPTAMNRLVNGDVGSGKTIVAGIAAYVGTKSGFKVVVMVPTEVLASQHYSTFCNLFERYGISVGLLTSSMKKISTEETPKGKKVSKPEQADIVIGTQALLQKSVNLDNVGLVIVDEQHRFGVTQRAALRQIPSSGESSDDMSQELGKRSPHFLSMTATPIPRTLYLALFDDLDVSVIKQKPKNRKEIKTRCVEPHNRDKAYQFIRKQIESSRQVFVICPLIEQQEDVLNERSLELWEEDRKSVAREYEKLSKHVFPEFRVAMLHGKMKPKEKDSILTDFADKKFDILVSTSVIEVGIDVPNATVMIIENAERFGLAQIHQFRGRVGRGEQQSFCFLFSNSRSFGAIERLHKLEEISDGFKLAEIDLETRGPGDILGTLQSGQVQLKMASFCDRMLIEQASEAASFVFREDPTLARLPALKERILRLEMNKHME